jgi:hypothetical protein
MPLGHLGKFLSIPRLGAFSVFTLFSIFLIFGQDVFNFQEPCALLPPIVNVDINGLPVTFQPSKPILVKPGDRVIISAKIKTKPEICYGTLSTEWRVTFTSSLTQLINTTSEVKEGTLELSVNDHPSGDNLVTLTIRAPEGDPQRVYLLFKLEETGP